MAETVTTENVKKRGPRTTKKQLEIMVNFLDTNRLLLAGKIEPKDVNQKRLEWNELVRQLNSCPQGPQKTLAEWKQVLKEFKTNTRRKAREIFVAQNATGGGRGTQKKLTDVEERLMGLLSKVTVEGAPIPEAGLPLVVSDIEQCFSFEKINNLGNTLILPVAGTEEIIQEINIEQTNCSTPSGRKKYTKPKRKIVAKSNSQLPKLLEQQITITENLSKSVDKLGDAIFALSNSIEKLALK